MHDFHLPQNRVKPAADLIRNPTARRYATYKIGVGTDRMRGGERRVDGIDPHCLQMPRTKQIINKLSSSYLPLSDCTALDRSDHNIRSYGG